MYGTERQLLLNTVVRVLYFH